MQTQMTTYIADNIMYPLCMMQFKIAEERQTLQRNKSRLCCWYLSSANTTYVTPNYVGHFAD